MNKQLTTPAAKLQEAVRAYTWATLEAKNLLLCISIAADHGECVDDDLRPALGVAIDGVARLLDGVACKFDHLANATLIEEAEVPSG